MDDKPFRVTYPEPKVLHGSDPAAIRVRAIEYLLANPDALRVDPMFIEGKK